MQPSRTYLALDRADLAQQTLDHVTDSHTRRNGVRVDNDVGRNSYTIPSRN
jgi:hypothetical protein